MTTPPGDAARGILVEGAPALARGDGLESTLRVLLEALAAPLEVLSAAVVTVDASGERPAIVASFGLDSAAAAGLGVAIQNPGHPIRRTVADPVATFDVQPTVPGGPGLRSHLPLIVRRAGTNTVLGVLALAHDRRIDMESRAIVLAAADLAAVAIDRQVST
ncbi:MAG: hypothetical protein ACHQ3P_00420 [Candidatus Limnocylindrales bacterium]